MGKLLLFLSTCFALFFLFAVVKAEGCLSVENTEPCPAENGGQRVVGGERACLTQFPWLVYVECTR